MDNMLGVDVLDRREKLPHDLLGKLLEMVRLFAFQVLAEGSTIAILCYQIIGRVVFVNFIGLNDIGMVEFE
jgi:hypothetical protein